MTTLKQETTERLKRRYRICLQTLANLRQEIKAFDKLGVDPDFGLDETNRLIELMQTKCEAIRGEIDARFAPRVLAK